MLEEIKKTIKEIIRYKLKRKNTLFVIKKVIDQANILEKNIKIPKISSKNGFLKN